MAKAVAKCKDCIVEGVQTCRPAPFPGPRCATHQRAARNRRRARAHELRIRANFEIDARVYWILYQSQGGMCFICHQARGVARRLAVDHDHSCTVGHPPDKGCRECIRALLCGRCNQLLGQFPLAALQRAIIVLTDPPAQKILRVISPTAEHSDIPSPLGDHE